MKTKKLLFSALLISIFAVIFCAMSFLNVYYAVNKVIAYVDDGKVKNLSGYSLSDNAVIVSELWDSSTNAFNSDNMQTLIEMIAPYVEESSDLVTFGVNVTAQTLRESTLNKSAGLDIAVELGGLTWTITYLSKDNNGNIIATLWIADFEQLKDKYYYDSSGKTIFSGASAMTPWSEYSERRTDFSYQSNMYGTSLIRSQVLNNGGTCATGRNSIGGTTSKHADSVFAPFTLSTADGGSGIYDHIVTPENISWQENGQSAILHAGLDYNLANENWGVISDEEFGASSGNYSNRNNNVFNSRWRTDRIWLPSVSEVSSDGLWGLSYEQKSNVSFTWLRSGMYDGRYVYGLTNRGIFTTSTVTSYGYVRPALHLSLTSAAQSAGVSLSSVNSGNTNLIEELPETGIKLNLSIVLVTIILGVVLVVVTFKRKEQC